MKKRLLAGLLSLCLMLSMVPATALALDDGTEADQDVTTNMDPTTPDDPVLPDDPDSEEKITVEEGSQGTTPDTPETPSDGDDIGPDDENSIPNNENSMLGEQPVTLFDVPELEVEATDETGILAPSARDNSFFANGTPITITAEIPSNATSTSLDNFTATGNSAYISWEEDNATKYVGVNKNVSVYGGKDGSASSVTVPSTNITMTGGCVRDVYGGNLGSKDKTEENNSKVLGDITMNFSDDAIVANLLHGGGAYNTSVDGTVRMNFENATKMNDPDNDIWPYINGGVYDNGSAGSRDIANGKMDTYAVVNRVEITATDSDLYLVGAGGSGSTKVCSGDVTLDNCRIAALYLSGINGEVEESSLQATDCDITDFAATNRGFVGVGDATFTNSDIGNFQVGATEGCFASDSGTPDGSGVTNHVTYNLDADTKVANALFTPYISKDQSGYTAAFQNVTINSEEPLNLKVPQFQFAQGQFQTTFVVPEDSTLTLNNVNVTVEPGNTLDNIGTISMDDDSKLTVASGATVSNAGTIQGTVDGTVSQYAARANGVGYTTLQGAIDATTDSTIILLKNVDENVTIPTGSNITLDLNGFTLNGGTASGKAALTNYGTVVIRDSSKDQTGTIKRAENGETSAYYVLDNHGVMSIESGNIYNNSGDNKNGASLVRNIGTNSSLATLNISGGTLQQDNFIAVKNDDYGTLNISGGKIISKNNQAVQNWNEAEITGGQMTGNVITWSYTEVPNNAKMEISGGLIDGSVQSINYYSNGSYGPAPQVQISGNASITGSLGTYTYNNGVQIPVKDGQALITVTGGQFGNPVDEYYLDERLNAQLKSASNLETPYSYYTSLKAAVAAAEPGDVVSVITQDPDTQTYTAILDYNDGQTAQVTYVVTANTLITLPTPTREGYRFDGWYEGSKRVDSPYTVATNVTLTAHWDRISSGGASHPEAGSSSSSSDRYQIDKPSNVENGSIKVSDSKAQKGDTVTITVTPDEGYELDKLAVYDEDGDEIDLKDKGDGKFTFEMPKGDVEIEVSFTAIEDEAIKADFADVAAGDWYADAVQYVFENGMMSGTSETTFSPNLTTTRGMIVTILYRLEGTPAVTGTTAFTDVAAGQYYADAVAWAAQNGIVSGTSATTFSPDGVITREQMAAILYRYAQHKGYDVTAKADLSVFTDAAQVSTYATDAMAWANASGLISGTSATTLSPAGTATRAQVATILMRFCENIAK